MGCLVGDLEKGTEAVPSQGRQVSRVCIAKQRSSVRARGHLGTSMLSGRPSALVLVGVSFSYSGAETCHVDV